MGAIGVTLPVDYSMDADRLMDMFMVELHNRVPCEMQGFYRDGIGQANNKQWAVDSDAVLLTLVRQLIPPDEPVFCNITQTGHLVSKELAYVSRHGLEELTTRLLANCALAALDRHTIFQMTDGAVNFAGERVSYYLSNVNLCLFMKHVWSEHRLALIFLGSISGMSSVGWEYMYLFLGSREAPTINPDGFHHVFQRIGVLFFPDPLTADKPTRGRFIIS